MADDLERSVDAGRLLALVNGLFLAVGVPGDEADLVADTLVTADLRGMHSHGCIRIPTYLERVIRGGARPGRKGVILRETAATVLLDGEDGLGQVIALRAMDEAMRKARDAGIGAVGVLRSNHYGEAAYYVLHAARHDMIGVLATNGTPNMPPWGGTTKLTGPLPFTAAVPAAEMQPFVIDAALGMTSKGRLFYYAGKGEAVPPGWGVDSTGAPTTDPQAILDGGWILPIGGHKGFGITMFLEILAGILTGGPFGAAIRDLHGTTPELSQELGHFAIAIDPEAFMPRERFKQRMDDYLRSIKASERAPGVEEILIPGEPEYRREQARRAQGVPLSRAVLDELNRLARKHRQLPI